MPKNTNQVNLNNKDSYAGVNDSSILLTSTIRQEMEIGWVVMKKLNKYMFLSTPTAEGTETIGLTDCNHHAYV